MRLSRTTHRVAKRIGDQKGQYWTASLTELGANQVDELITGSVVVLAGVTITPQDVVGSIEEAAQILLRLSPPNTRKEAGSGRGDDESLEGLASLEDVAGVTRAVTRALSRAISQSPTLPIPPQTYQQSQPIEHDSTLCHRGGATENEEPIQPF